MQLKMDEWAYEAVRIRERFRCLRCGGAGANWHHRRSKRVKDEHTHCPCNGVWLCGSGTTGCHGHVHANPFVSRQSGLIVSQHEGQPATVPVVSVVHGGSILLDCDGQFQPLREE